MSLSKRKTEHSSPWGLLSVMSGLMAAIFLLGTITLYLVKPSAERFFGQDRYAWHTSSANTGDTEYHKNPFVLPGAVWQGLSSKNGTTPYYDLDALAAAEKVLLRQIQQEGTVLLRNANDALPLHQGMKISLFSTSSVDPVYSFGPNNRYIQHPESLIDQLQEAGLFVNPALVSFYNNEAAAYRRSMKKWFQSGDFTINEAPWSMYTPKVLSSFSDYADAAIVVLSRISSEDNDLPRTNADLESKRQDALVTGTLGPLVNDSHNDGENGNSLALSAQEREMIEQVKAYKQAGVFKRIIVLLNTCNPIQLDFIQDDVIDSILWIGLPGNEGMAGVADVLTGAVSPSGSLPDTFYVNALDTPAMVNFGKTRFANSSQELAEIGADCYTVYEENIYIGYQYAESRYYDWVLGQNNAGDFDYDALVAYPFGYGESYTTFEITEFTLHPQADALIFTARVTNTGTMAGKKSVQLYINAPYTQMDRERHIERSAVALCAYEKTGELAGGESELVTLRVPLEMLRVYDALAEQTYLLEAGDYRFTVACGAHDAANAFLKDVMEHKADVLCYTVEKTDAQLFSAAQETGAKITNAFNNADLRLLEGGLQAERMQLLSRSDWSGTYPKPESHEQGSIEMTPALLELCTTGKNTPLPSGTSSLPAYGQSNGLTLAMLRGLAYHDPLWDRLLDQMTYAEQKLLCAHGAHVTQPITSISKPKSTEVNGCTMMLYIVSMYNSHLHTIYPSCPTLAAAMNDDLAYLFGEMIGWAGMAHNYQGIYAPGMNLHRTPYSGRNAEYYSEDPVLCALIGQAQVKGIQSTGMYTLAKHFALNDQETGRHGLCVFASEQTIREKYLLPFEYVLSARKGGSHGVMTSYNRIGTIWTGASQTLLSQVLRGEWGFDGMVISDSWKDIGDQSAIHRHVGNAVMMQLAGGNLLDCEDAGVYDRLSGTIDGSPEFRQALRESCKRILYTIVNSAAMNGIAQGDTIRRVVPLWEKILLGCDAAFVICFAAFLLLHLLCKRKKKYEHNVFL